MSHLDDFGKGTFRMWSGMRNLATREQRRLLAEIGEVQGLMPLLMKPRNHEKWTRRDKVLLRQHLRRISHLSPYLVLVLAPGGFFAMPALAWWLDRRRERDRALMANAAPSPKKAGITAVDAR
jgi:hypothetical protein